MIALWPCFVCASPRPCEHRERELLIYLVKRDRETQARLIAAAELERDAVRHASEKPLVTRVPAAALERRPPARAEQASFGFEREPRKAAGE